MKKPVCKECKNRQLNTCMLMQYQDGKPYVIASKSAFTEGCNILAFKTSPRWCPLKSEEEDNE